MKCKNCGEDVFPGQFRCDHCGTIHPTDGTKETVETKKTTKKSNKEE